jgi:hypothetical protein
MLNILAKDGILGAALEEHVVLEKMGSMTLVG